MIYIVSTIVLLGALIFIHELGHFTVAKLLGVRVERFSLGFPPKMIGKKVGETEYMISWVPLGGYVKMFGESPDEEEAIPVEEQDRSFSHKPAWARFLIVLAGPGFNLVFTLLVLWAIIWANGIEKNSTMVGRVTEGAPAAAAGLLVGDRIVSLDGQRVAEFSQVVGKVQASEGAPIEVEYERNGRTATLTITPENVPVETIFGDTENTWRIGIASYLPAVVGQVMGGSSAEEAGLLEDDEVLAIDGKPVLDWYDVLEAIQAGQGQPLDFTVRRQGVEQTIRVVPKMESMQDAQGEFQKIPSVGLLNKVEMQRLGPIDSLGFAWAKTSEWTKLTGLTLVKLFQRKVSAKTLGGPLFIAELAGDRAKAGMVEFIFLAAFISLNLGFLNLLPIPVLDGGHLFFFGLEMIIRRPIGIRIRERAQQVGMVLLLTLMVFIFYNDITRLATRWDRNSEEAPVEQTQPAQPQ